MKRTLVSLAFAFVWAAGATPVRDTGSSGPVSGPSLCFAGQPCDHTSFPVFVDPGAGFAWLRGPAGGANAGAVEGMIRGFAAEETPAAAAVEQQDGVSPFQLGSEVGALLLERASSASRSGRPVEEASEDFSTFAMAAAGVVVLGLAWFRRVGALAVASFVLLGAAASLSAAQRQRTENQKSPHDSTSVTLGSQKVSIDYNAPSARGRTVEGGLIPYGRVWRTGADAATMLSTAANLMIGNLRVPKGEYTLYTLASEGGWKLIVNKQTGQWGTQYDEAQDLGRVDLKLDKRASPAERFRITLQPEGATAATLQLSWGMTDASVPVTVAH